MGDLGHVPGVLEQDDVIGIEADGPVAGVLVRDALSQINDGDVMELVCEPVTHQTGVGRLHVVHDDPGMMIDFVGQAVGIGHLLQTLAGQFVPTIRVPAVVGLTAKGHHAIATLLCPKQAWRLSVIQPEGLTTLLIQVSSTGPRCTMVSTNSALCVTQASLGNHL